MRRRTLAWIAGMVAAGLGGVAAGAADGPPPELAGRWSGASIESGTPVLFDLELEVASDGTLGGFVTLPYNGFTRFRIPGLAWRGDDTLVTGLFGDEMQLLVDLPSGTLRGTVTESGEVTARVHLQRVVDIPLPASRREEVRIAVPVPMPAPSPGPGQPAINAAAVELAGSLVRPDAPGPHPCIVTIAGRGGGTRDSMGDMASRLVHLGIAVLIVDARGFGDSGGDPATTTGLDRVADAIASVDHVRARADIDPARVGLLSNSAGGWVAPHVIRLRPDLAAWVSIVGPAESLAEQQARAINALMQQAVDRGEADLTPEDFAAAFAYQAELTRRTMDGQPWSDVAPLVEAARGTPWWPYVDQPEDFSHPELDYFRRRGNFDPADALRAVRIPVLAFYAGEDWIVDADVNARRLAERLAEAGNPDVTIARMPGASHSMGLAPGLVGNRAGDAGTGEARWPDVWYRPWMRPPDSFVVLADWLRVRLAVSPEVRRRTPPMRPGR